MHQARCVIVHGTERVGSIREREAMRAEFVAVLVGVGTVLAEDPSLTVRAIPGRSPARVVLDSALRTPITAAVLNLDALTYLMTNRRHGDQGRRQALAERHIAVRRIPPGRGGLDISAVLRQLFSEGIRSIVVEGGPRVITSFLAANMADRAVISIAPQIRGQGTGAAGGLGDRLSAPPLRLNSRSVHLVGDRIIVAADIGALAATARGDLKDR